MRASACLPYRWASFGLAPDCAAAVIAVALNVWKCRSGRPAALRARSNWPRNVDGGRMPPVRAPDNSIASPPPSQWALICASNMAARPSGIGMSPALAAVLGSLSTHSPDRLRMTA